MDRSGEGATEAGGEGEPVRTRGYGIHILPDGSDHRFATVQWICDPGKAPRKGPVAFSDDYDDAVSRIPDGLEWRDRDPRDAPSVVETWFPSEAEEVPNVVGEP